MHARLQTGVVLSSAAILLASTAATQAADLSGGMVDYGAPIVTSAAPASAWEIWGDAALDVEYYENDFNYHETDINGSGEVIFRSRTGFSFKAGAFAGVDLDHDDTYGGLYTDIYYATPGFAVGVYGEYFTASYGYESFYAGAQAAKFFSAVDVGVWAGWASNDDNPDYYEAGTWLTGYLTPNDALGAFVSWEGNEFYDSYYIGGEAEHRFAGTNFSIWARGWYYDVVEGGDFSSWDVRGGVRVFFGPHGATLQDYRHVNPF